MTPEKYIRKHVLEICKKEGVNSVDADKIAEEVLVKYRRSSSFPSKSIVEYVARKIKTKKRVTRK